MGLLSKGPAEHRSAVVKSHFTVLDPPGLTYNDSTIDIPTESTPCDKLILERQGYTLKKKNLSRKSMTALNSALPLPWSVLVTQLPAVSSLTK